MDYADFILPWIIHPAGHLTNGNQSSGGARLDYRNAMEKWEGPVRAWRDPTMQEMEDKKTRNVDGKILVPIYDEKPQVEFGGAGFEAQDAFGRAKQSPSYSLGNAMHKALYLAGASRFSGALEGDVNQMERNSGNRYVNAMLGASALGDLYNYKNPDSNARFLFSVENGAPSLMLNVPLDADMKPVWKNSKNAMR